MNPKAPVNVASLTASEIVDDEPETYSLHQNYPNPFNPQTVIGFTLPQASTVTLKVYNILGQEVATLLDHQAMDEGLQEISFVANGFASGVYFYRLDAVSAAATDEDGLPISQQHVQMVRKMIMVK